MSENRSIKNVFSLFSPDDLLAVLKEDFVELEANPKSSRYGIHCALLAWHLTEWAWVMRFNKDFDAQRRSFRRQFQKRDDYLKFVRGECRALQIMQGVAEGSKHLATEAPIKRTVGDFANAIIGRGTVGTMRIGSEGSLAVQDGEQMIEFLPAVREAVHYWERKLAM